MIHAENIYKKYGDLEVLKGVSISINRGEIVSIVGRSGAGKSTLLHILGTLDKPSSGTVSFDGQRIEQLSDRKLSAFRNRHIGFVFQFHHLLPEFTALENVCIPAFIQGIRSNVAEHRAKELLDYLGLSHRFTHKPAQLSGGEQQRVAVARALINSPDAIFADEPSGNLDTQNSQELHELFLKLRNERGQTFVIVTHNQELATLADRNIHMLDGKIV
ncbi:MAG: ABC transporter ATP-binding protein [Candidatus Competibacteraceae bacterium]|nr:ABC transporter ATP-binding protein [Candidatus Competibacteraceae bacterium]